MGLKGYMSFSTETPKRQAGLSEKGNRTVLPEGCRIPVHKLDSSASGGRRPLWSPGNGAFVSAYLRFVSLHGPFVSGGPRPPEMTSDLPRSSPHLSRSSQSFLSLNSQCPFGVKSTYFRDKGSGSHGLSDQTFRPHGLACSPPHFLVVLPASRVVTSLPYIDS